ncbi:MAG: hypothetical protein ACJ77N_05355, partial [Chloroflexota bacterium]
MRRLRCQGRRRSVRRSGRWRLQGKGRYTTFGGEHIRLERRDALLGCLSTLHVTRQLAAQPGDLGLVLFVVRGGRWSRLELRHMCVGGCERRGERRDLCADGIASCV